MLPGERRACQNAAVAQKTLVFRLPREQGEALRRRLDSGAFEFRSVPHAVFSARGEGVVATYYRSGKLVVQGAEPETFAELHLGAAAPARPVRRDAPPATEPLIGSDESGKGDFFGPLVVAAVRLTPEDARALAGGPVRDSKLMSDEAVLRAGAALRSRFPHAIVQLDPPAYNALHARVRNLNPMLAELHVKAITELAEPGIRVVVDQFAHETLMQRALGALDVRMEQRPRAEEELAVAAASVLARERFLLELRRLSEEFAVELAKGAGPPADRSARRFVELHGTLKLGQVAKLHFKSAAKIPLRPGEGAR
jgi:ribonuclease HIII